MLLKIYKSTIKEIIKSPITWICFVPGFILLFVGRTEVKAPVLGRFQLLYLDTVTSCVSNAVMVACLVLLAAFCISIQYDKSNLFYDIELATRMKKGTYLVAKTLAYFTIFFTLSIFLSVENFISFYAFGLMDIPMPIFETLVRFIAAFIYIGIPICISFVCLVMAVTVISQKKSFGIIIGALCVLIPVLITRKPFSYPPRSIYGFLVNLQEQGRLDLLFPPLSDALLQMVIYLTIGFVSFGLLYWFFTKRKN